MLKKHLKIPAGMRDWLFKEAAEKRTMTNSLMDNMAGWGYEEVQTPILEYYQVLTVGEGSWGPDNLYKIIDRDGSILALRPEMTTPIARIAASKITGKPPWRLMYGAEVFRYENIQAGRQRGFNQVGVELIGQKGPEADSEVLALAIDSLKKIGLYNFTVSLGHTGVLRGLLASLSQEDVVLAHVQNLILEKDFVGLDQHLQKLGVKSDNRETLLSILTQHLTLEELRAKISNLPQSIKKAVSELDSIINILNDYDYLSYIHVDLSTLRSQKYYTGMVFEIYTPGIGYPIGGGGRYDELLRHFGKDYPATGFALGIERLLLSMEGQRESKKPVFLAGDSSRDVLKKAELLRKEGKIVVCELRSLSKEQAHKLAQEKALDFIWCQRGE